MKIKSNYLNAFRVANLSLSISLLCVCQVFFSPFFFFFLFYFSLISSSRFYFSLYDDLPFFVAAPSFRKI